MATATVMELAPRVDTFKEVKAGLSFDKYVGAPYWPELSFLINLGKNVHPKASEAKKLQAIAAGLDKMGKTQDDYELAQIRSKRPFYTINDTNPDKGDGEIIIPPRQFLSFLNHASMKAPKAIPRIGEKGLTFIGIKFADENGFRTGMKAKDAKIFGRFVKMEESNQRVWCESPYIEGFTATATLTVDEEIIKAEALLKLVEWGGRWIGLGACRPQGFGHFRPQAWSIR